MEENVITIELPDGTLERVAIAGTEPTEEELKAIQDTFFPSTDTEDVTANPDPEASAPFTSEDYYQGGRDVYGVGRNTVGQFFPAIVGAGANPVFGIGEFSESDKLSPIYLQLESEAPGWEDMSLRQKRNLFDNATLAANRAIFDNTGEENSLGFRVQRNTDEDGEPVTYLVPPAETASDSGLKRVMGGAAFETAKSIARLGEGVTDFLRITDPDTDFVKENFPTVPPENALEGAGTEIVSILVGAGTGAGLTTKLENAYGLSSKAANAISKQWAKIRNKKPEDIQAAAQAFAKTFIIGTGANVGATANTPQQSDPYFGDDVVEFLGIDPQDNRNLTNFADNVVFSGFLAGLGAAYKGLKAVKGKAFNTRMTKKEYRDVDQGAILFKMLDPNLEEAVPATVFAERARIMGEVLNNNSSFKSSLLENGEITTDTTTAIFMGAKEYFERAYGWQRSFMSADEFSKFVNESAEVMAGRMSSIRRARESSEIVQSGQAVMDGSMQDALTSTATKLGGEGATDVAAAELAAPIVGELTSASTVARNAAETRQMAEAGLNSTQTKNYVTDLLKDSLRNNPLGSNVASRDALDRMTGDQLYANWSASFNGYNEAFRNLPDLPLPVDDFVRLIEETYPDPKKWPDIIESVTITDTVSDPFPKLLSLVTPKSSTSPSGEVVTETYEEMVERLSARSPSFKDVFTQLRPQIEDRIKALQSRGLTQQAQQLIGLKRGIDTMAEGIGDPAFIQAKDMYAQHADTWLNSAPLRQFETAAKNVNPNLSGASGVPKGAPDMQRAGANARAEALESGFLPYQKQFADALAKTPDNVSPDLASAYIAEAINDIGRGLAAGQTPGSSQIISGIQEYLPVLERVAPDQVARFKAVVEDLRMAEAGLMSAAEVAAKADETYAAMIKAAKESEASRFIGNLTNNPQVKTNSPAVFNEIFSSNDAPDILNRLMQQAGNTNNPLIMEGMQSQYLTWLSQKITTNRRTGLTDGGQSAVSGYSPAQLSRALRDPASPVLKSLTIVFKDNPQRAAEVVRLMEIQDLIVNGRALRGDTFGSTTSYDKDVKKLMDRVVTLGFGVLNPTATIARNLGAAFTKGYAAELQRSAQATMDMMISDPKKFDEIMQAVAKDNEAGAVEMWTKYLGRAYYGTAVDEQTRESLPVE